MVVFSSDLVAPPFPNQSGKFKFIPFQSSKHLKRGFQSCKNSHIIILITFSISFRKNEVLNQIYPIKVKIIKFLDQELCNRRNLGITESVGSSAFLLICLDLGLEIRLRLFIWLIRDSLINQILMVSDEV